jgi:hypothetical protein
VLTTAIEVSKVLARNRVAHLACCTPGGSLVGRSCSVSGSPLIGSTAAAAQACVRRAADSLSSDGASSSHRMREGGHNKGLPVARSMM